MRGPGLLDAFQPYVSRSTESTSGKKVSACRAYRSARRLRAISPFRRPTVGSTIPAKSGGGATEPATMVDRHQSEVVRCARDARGRSTKGAPVPVQSRQQPRHRRLIFVGMLPASSRRFVRYALSCLPHTSHHTWLCAGGWPRAPALTRELWRSNHSATRRTSELLPIDRKQCNAHAKRLCV